MNQRSVGVIAFAVAMVAHSVAHAQSDADVGGYVGLIGTPTGGFTPTNNVLGLPETKASTALQFRYGRWEVGDIGQATNSVGLGITTRQGSVATTFELGYSHASRCTDCDDYMGGVDIQVPLSKTPIGTGAAFEVGVNPALGIGRTGSGSSHETMMSGAISLPLALSMPVGQHGALVPFVSPGFGVGHISFGNESFTGTRTMLGGGATLANADWPVRVTVSARKIFIERSPTIYGVGLSLHP